MAKCKDPAYVSCREHFNGERIPWGSNPTAVAQNQRHFLALKTRTHQEAFIVQLFKKADVIKSEADLINEIDFPNASPPMTAYFLQNLVIIMHASVKSHCQSYHDAFRSKQMTLLWISKNKWRVEHVWEDYCQLAKDLCSEKRKRDEIRNAFYEWLHKKDRWNDDGGDYYDTKLLPDSIDELLLSEGEISQCDSDNLGLDLNLN